MDDGLLDVVAMSPRSLAGWFWVAGKVVTGSRREIPVISYQRARTVEIRVASPTQTQLDGDPTGLATRVLVRVDPLALLVRAPSPNQQQPPPPHTAGAKRA